MYVEIQNRDTAGSRLSKMKVLIDNQLCGTVPDNAQDGQKYKVNCNGGKGLYGQQVKLVMGIDDYMNFNGIAVMYDINAKVKTRTAKLCHPSMNLQYDTYSAANALKGQLTHSAKAGKGKQWEADFCKTTSTLS